MQAIELGNRRQARDLLARLIKSNSNNAEYWVWMSSVMETRKECIYCLKEAIKIDPNNEEALHGLVIMGERPLDLEKILPYRVLHSDWKKTYQERKVEKKPSPPIFRKVAAFGMVTLMLVGFVTAGVIVLPTVLGPRPTPININRATATPSLLPSPAPGTPTVTLRQPTPLAELLGLSYTLTPIYVNTPYGQYEAYSQAMEYFADQDYVNAIIYLQQVAQMVPDSASTWYLIGEAYRLQGNLGEAQNAYARSLQIDTTFAPPYLGAARVRLALHPSEWEAAQVQLSEALRLDPNFGEAWLVLASSNINLNRFTQALDQLDTAESLMPHSALVHLERARVFKLQQRYPEAIAETNAALEIDQSLLPAYRMLGELYNLTGDLAASEEPLIIYTTYIHTESKPYGWLGMALAARNDWQGAIGAYDMALAINPNYWEVNILLGDVYLTVGQLDTAAINYQAALRFRPETFAANLGYARVLIEEGRMGNAYTQLNVADAYDTTTAERASLYYWRAISLEALNQPSSAANDWNALLALPEEALQPGWAQTAQQHLDALRMATPSRAVSFTRTPTPSRTATSSRTPTSQGALPATPTPR